MPRPSKGARLYLRERNDRASVWIIRDEGGVQRSTGTSDRREAERALASYIAGRDRAGPSRRPEDVTLGEVLDLYATEREAHVAAPERIGYAITALLGFWGPLAVSDVKGATCRRYAKLRARSDGTIRRELGVLRAALRHAEIEGIVTHAPAVWLPERPAPRERHLSREEVAWLLRASRHLRIDGRHLTRFILASVYTGTRKAATLALAIDQASTRGGWVDTERGVLYRQPEGKRQTKKRQPATRLPNRLLAHIRRWKAQGARFVVQDYRGAQVGDIKNGWKRCVRLAEEMARAKGATLNLSDVMPHSLRHTAATWLMQSGADRWDAAGFLGMSSETLERVYGHHHPDHQASAVKAMDRGQKRA